MEKYGSCLAVQPPRFYKYYIYHVILSDQQKMNIQNKIFFHQEFSLFLSFFPPVIENWGGGNKLMVHRRSL